MAEETSARRNPPFQSISFTLVQDRLGRKLFRMKRVGEEYELHVEKGSSSNPSTQFTRMVPQETAQRFKDALDALGVFSWEEKYGDASAPGSMRWSLNTVFKEDVFSVASKGGSDAPRAFDAFLEELYKLDFPRPEKATPSPAVAAKSPIPTMGAAGFEMSNALRSMGLDLSSLPEGMGDALSQMLGSVSSADAIDAMSQMRRNPMEMQQRMKDEFSHLSPDEQEKMIDALSKTGIASRAWWERFLRGL